MRVVLTACALSVLLAPASARGAALVPLASAGAWSGTPIHVASPPGDARVFVVLRGGTVRIVRGGALQPTPFLTVPSVDTSGERGLLSIAFPPDHATSGLVYVFAVVSGQIRILEYRIGSNPDVADPASARIVLAQDVVATNHIGGQLAFGPDGMLYVTVGENAVPANSQSLSNVLGKVLRIDPRAAGGAPYTIPVDNPFAGVPGARGEIWALGLRNPYRAAFAPDGRLVIGDVGQGAFEEVNIGAAGANFGWPTCEGPCSPANPTLTNPLHTYGNPPSGCAAIITGHVVRDPDLTGLTGRFLFGDLCTQPLRTLDLSPAGPDPRVESLTTGGGNDLIGFGEDAAGCSYVLADGTAYRVGADALAGTACPHAPTIPPPPPPRPGPSAGAPP
ncbi:MAG: sorbosone dehydrogenase family protein, partial [Baekduiaceae bacterium]